MCVCVFVGHRPDRAEGKRHRGVDDRFLDGGEKDRMEECGARRSSAGNNCCLLQLRLQQQEEGAKRVR